MGIEGGWWTFTPETDYKTCPICNGTGIDNSLDHNCQRCGGTGSIRVENNTED